jgi:micrococcal nuclease
MIGRRTAVGAALAVLLGVVAPAHAQRVRQVFDGDTISVANVGVVRLIGVDAPEKHGSYRASEPFGDAAAAYLRDLLQGKDVRLEYDGPRTDPYKRTLAYVFLADGRLANLEVIRAGWAETYRRFSFVRKADFLAAEADAKAARRGMWARRRP